MERWERHLLWAEWAKVLTIAFTLLAMFGLLFDCSGGVE